MQIFIASFILTVTHRPLFGKKKILKNFCLIVHCLLVSFVFSKAHQRNKTNRTQHEELVDKIFSQNGCTLQIKEQVTLFWYVHYKNNVLSRFL